MAPFTSPSNAEATNSASAFTDTVLSAALAAVLGFLWTVPHTSQGRTLRHASTGRSRPRRHRDVVHTGLAGARRRMMAGIDPPPEPEEPKAHRSRQGWLDVAEAGTLLGVRFVVVLGTLLGRSTARAFVALLVLYFVLLRPDVRSSSRAYLRRIGLAHGFWDVYAHVRCFADAAVDRLFLLRGQFHHYRITQNGHEHLVRLKEQKRGAILLGAHLGSFEAMRMRSDVHGIPLNIVGYFRNTARLNSVLSKIEPCAQRALHRGRPRLSRFHPQGQGAHRGG